ncbi:MAG: carbon-nitrogen hydrolase [Cyclobacteriaceae bacterium]|nr:carbon-nitrogen hydrolase [Cyclobacteriaceae bacterium]
MKKFLIGLIVLFIFWGIWTYTGRQPIKVRAQAYLDTIEFITTSDSCSKNIVGIQPYMLPTDYQSENHFYQKLKLYFEEASNSGFFSSNTVVLLPEYLGTWLVISHEKKAVSTAATINGAMTTMVLSNPIQFIQRFFKGGNEKDRFAATLFKMKAPQMAEIYSSVFSSLAKEYGVTINAGSIVLPGPYIMNKNKIGIDTKQPLYNTSFVFYPDGTIDSTIIKKSFPISSELPFVTAYPVEKLDVFDLVIGKTAILVCADSWHPESYKRIEELKAEVVLVNSYCAGSNTMDTPWKGYDGKEEPEDVDQLDIGKLTEKEAWIRYALPGRLASTSARIGANIFLRGELWGLGSDGQPFLIFDGELLETTQSDRGGIWNLCF